MPEAILKLAAEARAGDHGADVQSVDFFVAQKFRHMALDNLLGQSFGDRGFADSRIAQQHGVVLGSTG